MEMKEKKVFGIKPEEYSMKGSLNHTTMSEEDIIKKLDNAMATGETVKAYCLRCNKEGDLLISFDPKVKNVVGLIPNSEFSYKDTHMGKRLSRVGLSLEFKVLSKHPDKENQVTTYILSRKSVVEGIKETYVRDLEAGMIMEGVVTGVQEWGAFIDVGGDVQGLLGIRDMINNFVTNPHELFKIGDKVKVIVKEVQKKDNDIKIYFSRKELMPTWDDIDNFYHEGDVLVGTIKGRIDTGFFVWLDETFEGLCEYTPNFRFTIGDKVRVKILKINKKHQKIRLKVVL